MSILSVPFCSFKPHRIISCACRSAEHSSAKCNKSRTHSRSGWAGALPCTVQLRLVPPLPDSLYSKETKKQAAFPQNGELLWSLHPLRRPGGWRWRGDSKKHLPFTMLTPQTSATCPGPKRQIAPGVQATKHTSVNKAMLFWKTSSLKENSTPPPPTPNSFLLFFPDSLGRDSSVFEGPEAVRAGGRAGGLWAQAGWNHFSGIVEASWNERHQTWRSNFCFNIIVCVSVRVRVCQGYSPLLIPSSLLYREDSRGNVNLLSEMDLPKKL